MAVETKVRRLPRDTGASGWNAILPPRTPSPTLEGATTADVLVIGAGIAGLAAARRLRQLDDGLRIALLDAVRVGEGPAGRNSGCMIDLPHDLSSSNYGGALDKDRAQIAANRAAIDFASSAAEEFGLPEEALRRVGKVNGAATAKGARHNADYARHLTALGEAHETLDAAAMQALTGTDYYREGLFTPGAAILQPAIYVRGLADGLRGAGVALHEGSPVTALVRDGATLTAQTPGGSVAAPRVILAVNGHAESFGFFAGRLAHVCTYASMTRALTAEECARLGGAPDWALTPADPLGTTVRRVAGIGGHRIVVRNRFTFDPSLEVDEARLDRMAATHRRSFEARFPMLREVAMEHVWAGRLCLSRNDAPAFGEIDAGLFAACCQNGLGLARGTHAGMAAAELALDQSGDAARRELSQAPPRPLPPKPIAWAGATARIRWGELSAGREL
ncbi:MAG: FAD-binding oxidoreductase [Pseudomonadota bacterium]